MSVGPCRPDESRDDYIKRVVNAAPPLSPEDVKVLAPLLRLGAARLAAEQAVAPEEAPPATAAVLLSVKQ
jgi:hypothetical protein